MVINKKYVTEDNDYGICVSVTNSDSMKISNYCSINCNNIPCYDLTCRNQGRCRKKLDGYNKYYYYCQCSDGFSGFDCSQKTIKSINSVICGGVNNVPCKEEPQRILSRQKRATFCVSNPCQNGGICSEGASNFNCTCLNGFKGTTCSEIDCAKSQCKFGSTCNATTSKCDCLTGFQGTLCEIKTDLCAPTNPCQNGVKCYDLLNDYECVDNLTIRKYGGDKNASMALTGCNANPCQASPRTLCQPTFNGTTHSYTCMCPPGLTDSNCDKDTTYHIRTDQAFQNKFTSVSQMKYSLILNTTDPEGFIFLFTFDDITTLFMGIEVLDHGIRLSTENEQKMLIPANTITKAAINAPYQIILFLTSIRSNVFVLCLYIRVENVPQGYFCVTYPKSQMSGTFYLGKPQVISSNSKMKDLFGNMRSIEGCFIDFRINDVIFNIVTLPKTCFRQISCTPTSCNVVRDRSTQCINYWITKDCVCKRPFYGEECGSEEQAYTSTSTTTSYVQLEYESVGNSLTLPASITKSNQLTISLFLTTRAEYGILAYIGSFPPTSQSSTEMVFFGVEVTEGYLTVLSKLSGQNVIERKSFKKSLAWKINDGKMKFVSFSLDSQSNISIVFNSYEFNETFVSYTDSHTQQFSNNFVPNLIGALKDINIVWGGSAPPTVSRSAAATNNQVNLPNKAIPSTEAFPTNIFLNSSSIIATFKNIYINEFQDTSDTSVTQILKHKSEIAISKTVPPPVNCINNTCQNSGSCTIDVFGARKCNCITGYFGDSCQYVDLCSNSTTNNCPADQNCISRPYGYDCNSIFSFTKPQKSIQIVVNDKSVQFSNFTIRLRTRAVNTYILAMSSDQNQVILNIDAQGKLMGRLMDSDNANLAAPVVSNNSITDANWHSVEFLFSPALQITVDNLISRASDYGVVPLTPVSNVDSLILGDSANSFLGCVDRPRLNDYVIPFTTNNINSSLSLDSVVVLSEVGVLGSCNGSNVCMPSPCLNNATACNDDFNRFKCVCAANYEGERCQIATCAALPPCVNNRTGCSQICPLNTNNSVCTSNPNQPVYGCLCNPGWTGPLCNFTDPCAASPSPCKNNGVCQTKYTAANQTIEFICNCTTGWSGPTCEVTFVNVFSSAGLIISIIVAVFVFLIVIALTIWACCYYKALQSGDSYQPYKAESHNTNDLGVNNVLSKPIQEKLI